MNYYEHHIGDYDQATAHLTACEDGIYGRLIRWYMASETPLPTDLKTVQRRVRAHSRDERVAVQTVLAEFFELREDGYHQHRCDEEIARFKDKRAKAKASAEVRWSQRQPQSEGNANADADASSEHMRTHCEGNALQTPDSRLQEDTPPPARARVREIGEPPNLNREAFERWETYLRLEVGKPLGVFSRPGAMTQLVAFGDADAQSAIVENCINRRSKNLHPLDERALDSGSRTGQPRRRLRTPDEIEAEEMARAQQ